MAQDAEAQASLPPPRSFSFKRSSSLQFGTATVIPDVKASFLGRLKKKMTPRPAVRRDATPSPPSVVTPSTSASDGTGSRRSWWSNLRRRSSGSTDANNDSNSASDGKLRRFVRSLSLRSKREALQQAIDAARAECERKAAEIASLQCGYDTQVTRVIPQLEQIISDLSKSVREAEETVRQRTEVHDCDEERIATLKADSSFEARLGLEREIGRLGLIIESLKEQLAERVAETAWLIAHVDALNNDLNQTVVMSPEQRLQRKKEIEGKLAEWQGAADSAREELALSQGTADRRRLEIGELREEIMMLRQEDPRRHVFVPVDYGYPEDRVSPCEIAAIVASADSKKPCPCPGCSCPGVPASEWLKVVEPLLVASLAENKTWREWKMKLDRQHAVNPESLARLTEMVGGIAGPPELVDFSPPVAFLDEYKHVEFGLRVGLKNAYNDAMEREVARMRRRSDDEWRRLWRARAAEQKAREEAAALLRQQQAEDDAWYLGHQEPDAADLQEAFPEASSAVAQSAGGANASQDAESEDKEANGQSSSIESVVEMASS